MAFRFVSFPQIYDFLLNSKLFFDNGTNFRRIITSVSGARRCVPGQKIIFAWNYPVSRMKFSRLIARTIDFFYIAPLRRLMPLQTFRYAACGALNVALSLLLYYVAYHYLLGEQNLSLLVVDGAEGPAPDIVLSPHIAALCIVFPIITVTGFWLNRNVAFRHSPLRHRTQALRYLLSTLVSLLVNYGCQKLFVDVLSIWPTPAQALSTVVVTVYSYLAQKYFSFRGCPDPDQKR